MRVKYKNCIKIRQLPRRKMKSLNPWKLLRKNRYLLQNCRLYQILRKIKVIQNHYHYQRWKKLKKEKLAEILVNYQNYIQNHQLLKKRMRIRISSNKHQNHEFT